MGSWLASPHPSTVFLGSILYMNAQGHAAPELSALANGGTAKRTICLANSNQKIVAEFTSLKSHHVANTI